MKPTLTQKLAKAGIIILAILLIQVSQSIYSSASDTPIPTKQEKAGDRASKIPGVPPDRLTTWHSSNAQVVEDKNALKGQINKSAAGSGTDVSSGDSGTSISTDTYVAPLLGQDDTFMLPDSNTRDYGISSGAATTTYPIDPVGTNYNTGTATGTGTGTGTATGTGTDTGTGTLTHSDVDTMSVMMLADEARRIREEWARVNQEIVKKLEEQERIDQEKDYWDKRFDDLIGTETSTGTWTDPGTGTWTDPGTGTGTLTVTGDTDTDTSTGTWTGTGTGTGTLTTTGTDARIDEMNRIINELDRLNKEMRLNREAEDRLRNQLNDLKQRDDEIHLEIERIQGKLRLS